MTYLGLLASTRGSLANMRDLLASNLQAAIVMAFDHTKVQEGALQSSCEYLRDTCIVGILLHLDARYLTCANQHVIDMTVVLPCSECRTETNAE